VLTGGAILAVLVPGAFPETSNLVLIGYGLGFVRHWHEGWGAFPFPTPEILFLGRLPAEAADAVAGVGCIGTGVLLVLWSLWLQPRHKEPYFLLDVEIHPSYRGTSGHERWSP
jgi:hypothetical protein